MEWNEGDGDGYDTGMVTVCGKGNGHQTRRRDVKWTTLELFFHSHRQRRRRFRFRFRSPSASPKGS